MMKALGFLTGVCLTVAVVALLLRWWQPQPSDDVSPAAVAGDVQPVNVASTANDGVSIDIGRKAANAQVAAKIDVSATSATTSSDVIKGTTVDADTTISPLLPPVEDDERQNLGAAKPFVDQTATAKTQTTEVTAEGMDLRAPINNRPQDTGNNDATQTHVFWGPFRSEWAAKGFAQRLTNATQITIEVVESGSGKYQAAFDYQDEKQRLEHMERIESITGLQLE